MNLAALYFSSPCLPCRWPPDRPNRTFIARPFLNTFDQNVTTRRIGALPSDVAFGSNSEVRTLNREVGFTLNNGRIRRRFVTLSQIARRSQRPGLCLGWQMFWCLAVR
jgi:hypothetical protein